MLPDDLKALKQGPRPVDQVLYAVVAGMVVVMVIDIGMGLARAAGWLP